MDEEKEKGLNSLLKRLGKVDFEPIKKEKPAGEEGAKEKEFTPPSPATAPPPPPKRAPEQPEAKAPLTPQAAIPAKKATGTEDATIVTF
jgi:hypothetical protein